MSDSEIELRGCDSGREGSSAMSIPALPQGERVRFATPVSEARYWWDVRTGDERYTILTRQAPFRPKGERACTIIDRVRGVRGPCDRIGQAWDSHMDDEACASLLHALQAHDTGVARREEQHRAQGITSWPVVELEVEVSYRNNVPVDVREVSGR